jgi:hypothetical protein
MLRKANIRWLYTRFAPSLAQVLEPRHDPSEGSYPVSCVRSGRGTMRAEDARGIPAQSRTPLSILVDEDNLALSLDRNLTLSIRCWGRGTIRRWSPTQSKDLLTVINICWLYIRFAPSLAQVLGPRHDPSVVDSPHARPATVSALHLVLPHPRPIK